MSTTEYGKTVLLNNLGPRLVENLYVAGTDGGADERDGDDDYDEHDKRLFVSILLFATHSQVRSHYIYTTTHRQPSFWRITKICVAHTQNSSSPCSFICGLGEADVALDTISGGTSWRGTM